MVEQVYRPRRPKESPLWQCLCAHFYDFIQAYPEKYEKKYGFLKPVVEDVVNKYLDCGDLSKGFARIYCENCKKSMLLPFSCKGRWFCPSRHEKKVLLFGEFIAAITQHIPNKGFQMVRYYGWYSNRARGERARHEAETGAPDTTEVDVIDVSEYHPPRIPSKKWRELIKKVWEVDPLICSHCGAEMKLIALIDDDQVIEKILRHLKLWPEQTALACLSRAPPDTPPSDGGERIVELCFDDPFPDYDTEPVMAHANDPDFAA